MSIARWLIRLKNNANLAKAFSTDAKTNPKDVKDTHFGFQIAEALKEPGKGKLNTKLYEHKSYVFTFSTRGFQNSRKFI